MLRTIKITDTVQGVTHIEYIVTCPKCHKDNRIPETYYAWWVRSLGMEPSALLHKECGGSILNNDYYISPWWSDGGLCSVGTPSGYNPCASDREHSSNESKLIQTEETTKSSTCYHTTYVYTTFSDAYKTLKSFIEPVKALNEVETTSIVQEDKDVGI